MSERKTSQYFKYALGEILLVVIGILIALELNNWNQNRRDHREELYLLESFNRNLLKIWKLSHNVSQIPNKEGKI